MPPRKRTLDEVLRTAEDVLRASGVDHVFVGGVTVLAFGMPRTTTDVDVIAAIDTGAIPQIVAGFRRAGFVTSAQDMHDALVEGGLHTLPGGLLRHLRSVRDPVAVGDLTDLQAAAAQMTMLHNGDPSDPRVRRAVASSSGRA